MKRWFGLVAGAGLAIFVTMGQVLACSIPLPKMTPTDVERSAVAFVGTVKAIEERDVEILDKWPEVMACQRLVLNGKAMCPADQPVTVAVFEVEEPIHGVAARQEFAVPQGQGSDCATDYTAGTRYLFGSSGINGQVWVVEEDMTVTEAMAAWETLPQFFDEGRRYKPGETPWMGFAANAEASLVDDTSRGLDAGVLAVLIGVLRWEQQAPDSLKVSDIRVMYYDRPNQQYVPLPDLADVVTADPEAYPAITICGTFDTGDGAGARRFAYTPGSPLTFSQKGENGGAEGEAADEMAPEMIDGLLETWGCLPAH
jgi:hypothetical protein